MSAELNTLAASLDTVARRLDRLKTEREAERKAVKGRFNLFTILRREHDEAGLHTPWLAYLLNPEAAHDCGPLFLKLFLATLKKHGIQPHAPGHPDYSFDLLEGFDVDRVAVGRESSFSDGRIDIKIECGKWGVILIENKIWAREQADQLQRYADYLREKCGPLKKKFLLLYLTPEGKASQTAGNFADGYYRISYQTHIVDWIDECLRATFRYININQALQQYRTLVAEHFCGSAGSNEYMERVIDILKKNPAVVEHLDDITAAFPKLRDECWQRFSSELRQQLADRGFALRPPITEVDRDLFFSQSYDLPTSQTSHLSVVVEWDEREKSLLIGAGLHHGGTHGQIIAAGQETAKRRQEFENSIAQWTAAFPHSFHLTEHPWFPLGFVLLVPRGLFLTPAFVAESLIRAFSMTERVRPLVDHIERYLAIAHDYWPKQIGS